MTHPNAPKAVIYVVAKTKDVSGYVIKVNKMESVQLPYLIAKRYMPAYAAGLAYVKTLGDPEPINWEGSKGVIAVTVSDGSRPLASWKRMDGLAGFTGTYDVHPMINMSGIK